MRRSGILVLLTATLAAGAAPLAAQAPPEMPPCIEPAPCVYVDPDPAEVEEVGETYVFTGQGWRPGRPVRVSLDEFCPPGAFCDNGLVERRVRPDGAGRFTFTVVYAPGGDGGFRPDAYAHPGRAWFVQRRGRRRIARDALGVPPPSTPAERAEARAVAAAVQRVHVRLERREDAAYRASDRTFRATKRCDALMDDGRLPWRRYEVLNALFILVMDRGVYAVVDRPLRRFADELEALALQDPVLRAAADAWIAAIRRPRPWTVRRACRAARRWRAAGYPRDARPVDPEQLEQIGFELTVSGSEAIDAGGRRMRALGAGRAAGLRFGGGLLERGEGNGIFG